METASRFFMLLNLPASRSDIKLPDFNKIAIDTGFIIRESSKMDASKFVQTIIQASVTGRGSYNQLATDLGNRTKDPMTRQSMEERFENESCVQFITAVHEEIIGAHFQPVSKALGSSKINRLLVEDSSGKKMPKSNAIHFPAHGNHHGSTAGVKIDFTYDVMRGAALTHTLHAATEQDKTIGKETLINVEENDLVLRDMGYFCLSEFTYIESLKAFWLTRLPLTTGITLEDGTDLEKYLKSTKSRVVDMPVLAGAEQKGCRLVAIRADKKVANERRRKRKKEAKEKGQTACQKSLIRDGWHIMLSNMESDEFSADQLAAIYRVRWGVEIQFRAWKQSTNLDAALNRKVKRIVTIQLRRAFQ